MAKNIITFPEFQRLVPLEINKDAFTNIKQEQDKRILTLKNENGEEYEIDLNNLSSFTDIHKVTTIRDYTKIKTPSIIAASLSLVGTLLTLIPALTAGSVISIVGAALFGIVSIFGFGIYLYNLKQGNPEKSFVELFLNDTEGREQLVRISKEIFSKLDGKDDLQDIIEVLTTQADKTGITYVSKDDENNFVAKKWEDHAIKSTYNQVVTPASPSITE